MGILRLSVRYGFVIPSLKAKVLVQQQSDTMLAPLKIFISESLVYQSTYSLVLTKINAPS